LPLQASITPPTTIITDDYLDLLSGADFSCSPLPLADAAADTGSAAAVHRLSVTFPGGAPGDAEGFAHLVSRFNTATSFVYGVETLLAHPALEKGAACVVHAGTSNPYFHIIDAAAGADSSFTLTLAPAMPASVFKYMSMKLTYNPNITAEVARRRAAGMDLGDERRLAEHEERERRLGASVTKSLADFALNWDPASQKAVTEKVGLVDTTTLYCNNCYFYLNAAVTVNLKVCAISKASGTSYYDTSVPPSQTKGVYSVSSGTCPTGAADAGCKTSAALALAATDCKPASEGGLGTSEAPTSLFNLGMTVEAYFQGSVGFNFEVKSDGISAAKGFPSACSKSASGSCTPTSLPAPFDKPVVIPTITVTVGAIPVELDPEITLKGAGYVDAIMPNFKLSFGASASVAAKLGGSVSFKEIPSSYVPSLTQIVHKDFSAAYNTLPFSLSGFTTAALATDFTFTPYVLLKVWKTFPVTASPIYQLKYSLAAQTARRLGYSLAALRELSTCASGTASSSASVAGSLGVTIGPVRTFDIVKKATGGSVDLSAITGASSFDKELIPLTTLASPASTKIDASGALSATAAGTCASVNTPIYAAGSVSGGASSAAAAGNSVALGLGLYVSAPSALPFGISL
jgi:hypothetical protein